MTNKTKRWGVALRKNVTPAKGESKHNSFWLADSYKVFRRFFTRDEARNFQKTWPSPTYIVDTLDEVVVR